MSMKMHKFFNKVWSIKRNFFHSNVFLLSFDFGPIVLTLRENCPYSEFSWFALRKKFPYSELFSSAFFLHFPAFGLITERYGVFFTNMDILYAVSFFPAFGLNTEYELNSVGIQENADQESSEYGHFLRSVNHLLWICLEMLLLSKM